MTQVYYRSRVDLLRDAGIMKLTAKNCLALSSLSQQQQAS